MSVIRRFDVTPSPEGKIILTIVQADGDAVTMTLEAVVAQRLAELLEDAAEHVRRNGGPMLQDQQ